MCSISAEVVIPCCLEHWHRSLVGVVLYRHDLFIYLFIHSFKKRVDWQLYSCIRPVSSRYLWHTAMIKVSHNYVMHTHPHHTCAYLCVLLLFPSIQICLISGWLVRYVSLFIDFAVTRRRHEGSVLLYHSVWADTGDVWLDCSRRHCR